MKKFNKLLFTIGMLPSSYKVSLTYEEQLLCIEKYIETQLYPAIINNEEAIEELQNYFENLDVQEEINNKLDEMAEQGILQEIITAYINLKSLLCFNTLQDMKQATNLINGCFTKTLGKNNINDNLGQLYIIRPLTSQDIIDEITLISLNNENLVAELILTNEVNVKYFNALGNNENDDTLAINKAIEFANLHNIPNVYFPKGIYLISSEIKLYSNIKYYGDYNNSIIKANNNFILNEIQTMITPYTNPMAEETGVKNIIIENLSFDNNNISIAGKDGIMHFRGVRNVTLKNLNITVHGENCWGIILFSSNHNINIDKININNISENNNLGGCLWIRNAIASINETSKTKNINITNCNFTSSAKDEIVAVQDSIINNCYVECNFNNINIEGLNDTYSPIGLFIFTLYHDDGQIKSNINNINIKGYASEAGLLVTYNNSNFKNIELTANNINCVMNTGRGIMGNPSYPINFSNCSINILDTSQACYGISLSNSKVNSTVAYSNITNSLIDLSEKRLHGTEHCNIITNNTIKTLGTGIHSYGYYQHAIISNNIIMADTNGIFMQPDNDTLSGDNCTIIGNYIQRLSNNSNNNSIALNLPYIKNSRSLANRIMLKSSSADSYGYHYEFNITGSENYEADNDFTLI